MKDVAAPLPVAVLCEILGVPDEDHDRIFEWSNLLVGGIDPDLGVSQEKVIPIYLQLFAYGQNLIADRRKNPRGDLMTAIANARMEDGEPIREDLLNGFFLLMVIAGNETTRNSIAGGMQTLIEHPDQHRRLREDPSLLPTAVEEILRWVSPVLYMRRTATRSIEIRGVPIAEGDKVVMWYPAANRDPAVFADPGRFDVGRDPNPHLAFGIGQHFCLGAQLARLQLTVMFSELLERLPRVELTGPVRRIRTNFLGAIKSMPVRCAAA
jgi:cholest-4-en-3-one 26-monooxygenase